MINEPISFKKQLVVASRQYFPLLIRYKNANPSENIKIIDKDAFLEKISYRLKEDPIPYLIKGGIDYSNAKKYLHAFLVGDIKKNSHLQDVFNKVAFCFEKDEYGLFELNGYSMKNVNGNWTKGIQFFAMDEDIEVKSLCERNNIPYKFINPEDLGIEKRNEIGKNAHPPIIYYQNKYEQFFSIFAQIRQRLLENPEDKDKIQILIEEGDKYYVKTFSELFDIETIVVSKNNLISYSSTRNKIKKIFESKDFSFGEEELKDEYLKELDSQISKYRLRELDDFSYAYANLLEIVNAKTFKDLSTDKGILASRDFSIGGERHIYATNFKHDVFYHVESDKDILPDDELERLGINPSYVKTLLDRRFRINFLKYNFIESLSLARQHLTEKVFDSQLIDEFQWKNEEIKKYKPTIEGKITSKAHNLYLADQYDKNFYYGKAKLDDEKEFRGYDNSFKGISESVVKNKKSWSITNLERYITCPFKYYISDLLPLKNDDYHSRWRGNLIHKLLEDINNPKYDFEDIWIEASEAYKKQVEKDKCEFDRKEEILLEILHFHLKNAMEAYFSQNGAMQIESYAAEVNVPFSIEDEEGNAYQFNSRIDKVVRTKTESGKSYYTIIDYKTGSEKFIITNTFLASSVQLPMYYYALKEQTEENSEAYNLTNEAIFGGFGIKQVYASSPKGLYCEDGYASLEAIKRNTKIKGEALNSADYSSSFDSTTKLTKEGKINAQLGGEYMSFYNNFISDDPESNECLVHKSRLKKYNMQDLVEDSKNALIETIKKIEKGEFPIAPTSSGNLKGVNSQNLACSFCAYKDICYRTTANIKDYAQDVIDHYKLGK